MLGVSFALRMVADSDSSMSWLRWASPLGWVEELRPLTGSRSLALVPILAFTIVVAGLAVHIAGVRDLGGSVLPDRECPRPHLWLSDGSFALGVRLARPTVTSWMVAIAATALLMGSIAKQAGSLLTSTPGVEKAVARLGVHGDGAAAYLGFTFVFIAVLVAFIAVGQLTAARAEEAEGRLDNLLVRPVSRAAWLLGRLALTIAIVIAGGVLAGATADAGLASQGAGVGSTRLLGAGINVVPPTLCILGVGVLVLGLWPRATSAVMYGMLAWSFLIGLVGGLFSSNHWLLDTSVFHHMATAPATAPNWQSAGVLVLIAVITGAVGVVGFRRRDLASE